MNFEKKEKLNTIKEIKIVQNINEEKEFQEKKENKNNDSNKKINHMNVIVEKEIIEDKYDNFKVKEIHRSKEILKINNHEPIKNIKTENIIDKDINNKTNIVDNLPENIRLSKVTKSKNNSMKTDENKKKRDSLNSNKSSSKVDLRHTFQYKKLKLCLENISQNDKENSFKENRTSRLNLDSNKLLEKPKHLNLKFSFIDKESKNKISPKVYPKKIGSDSNSSNSSIYEYDKPQNNEENSIKNNSSNKKKINFSNSETKITKYSKNYLSNIKKIKAFSDINSEKISNIYYKEKSSNIRKQFLLNNLEDKKEFEFKVEETLNPKDINKNENLNSKKKEFPKEKKVKKMYKNKTDSHLNKNLKNNKLNDIKQIKNLKKENSELNKKVNMEKITNIKQTNINSKSEKNKILKKKYKKSLTEPPVKDANEPNEKGNDSESYIIEGDSEYGDTEIF